MKIGIIGCGKQAPKHINGWLKNGATSFKVTDRDSETATQLAETFDGIETSSIEQLFADPEVKAVNICTPTPSHKGLIEESLSAGKHVFCEKPLCETLNDARMLEEFESNHESKCMVGYVYRFVPAFDKAKNWITHGSEGPLGEPVSAFFRIGGRGGHQGWKHMKESGGGAINEMLVHMVDMALWYFPDAALEFEVVSCNLLLPIRQIRGEAVTVDAEDYILVRAKTNNCEIVIQADFVSPSFTQYIELHGDKGSFMGSIVPSHPSYVLSTEAWEDNEAGRISLDGLETDLFFLQMQEFKRAIEEQRTPDRNSLNDSVVLAEAMNQIREQLK